ncbi:glycosyltransferase family 4 protein [Yeosuana marina]|uniref:glycosyltransferase family 4 protein n=1 Tax=Yeosuana marina TaxID=1565536 RepID=UPI00141DAC15|nr:glycosyltransferase family 4 protein [Yeosuana marina]
MKLIYITEQLYLHGGAEKTLTQKLNYWADTYNYEVLLITSEQKNNKPCYPLSEKVNHIDLNINYAAGSYFSWKNLNKISTHYKLLKNEIEKFNPDAIFLISLSWVRFILPIIGKNYKIYNEYHTSYFGFYMGYKKSSFLGKIKFKLKQFFIERVENYYTNIIFLNESELKHYKRKNGVVISNFFDPIDNELEVTKKNQIISLGRLSFQKGYDMLIDAWAKIDSKITDWTLLIYGNGDDKTQLLNLISSYNFKNTVEIRDAISNVNPILAESKFYVMSSRFETFPMVLLEALSHGLPVVSFDCPTGPRSIVKEHEDGVLIKPNDISELADKILSLIKNEKLVKEMSNKAKENIYRFNPKIVMKRFDDLITLNNN